MKKTSIMKSQALKRQKIFFACYYLRQNLPRGVLRSEIRGQQHQKALSAHFDASQSGLHSRKRPFKTAMNSNFCIGGKAVKG